MVPAAAAVGSGWYLIDGFGEHSKGGEGNGESQLQRKDAVHFSDETWNTKPSQLLQSGRSIGALPTEANYRSCFRDGLLHESLRLAFLEIGRLAAPNAASA